MKMNEENNLEYYSLPLFGSFNRENEKSIPLFGSLSGREWNRQKGTLIPFYFLKTSNYSRNLNELKEIKLDLMTFFNKISKIPIYIQSFILKYGSNNNIIIKWFHSFLFMLLLNKVTYISFISIPLF